MQINDITQGRMEVVNNSECNRSAVGVMRDAKRVTDRVPEWDQIICIPVHSLKEVSQQVVSRSLCARSGTDDVLQTIMLECIDYQHLTKVR